MKQHALGADVGAAQTGCLSDTLALSYRNQRTLISKLIQAFKPSSITERIFIPAYSFTRRLAPKRRDDVSSLSVARGGPQGANPTRSGDPCAHRKWQNDQGNRKLPEPEP